MTGALTLGGTSNLTGDLAGLFSASAFSDVVTYGSLTGTFSSTSFSNIPSGDEAQLNYTLVPGAISVVVGQPTVAVSLDPSTPMAGMAIIANATPPLTPGSGPVTLTYVWTINGTVVRTTSNTTVLSDTLPSSFNTQHGDVIAVSVTPFDGVQNGATATATTTVADSPPTVRVSLSPNNPTIVSNLTATATTADSDGDPVTLTYVWSKNGHVIQTTADTTSLTDTLPILGNAARGDVVTLTVTPNDGIENGTPVTVSQIVIGFPPTVTVSLGPNNPTANQTLTANAIAADLEGNPVTLTYVWSVDGTTIQTTANTPSPIDTLSLAGNIVKGDLITLTVTPNDGQQTARPQPRQ